eukprot:m.30945 g.30945  ORF g.30945 m.30945 type:complete len:114 (-) comp5280_c0_seq1:58-399(-)
MADPRLRQLTIKTGVVKRLGKERAMNHKEIAAEERRAQKMRDEGRDEYDIKKQGEVIEECRMMVPNTQKRLAEAHAELSAMLDAEKDLEGTKEYTAAQDILNEVPLDDPQADQ